MGFRVEIGIDCVEPAELAPFWAEALGYQLGQPWHGGRYLDLVPPGSDQPAVYFQRVPEAKVVKNRLHLDLWTSEVAAEIERLVALGASKLGGVVEGEKGNWWQVMADPAGNEFCVCHELRPG
jgi:predicted enzyme related to lactoylglutathione lyase